MPTIQDTIGLARQYQQEGNFAQAEQLLRQVLQADLSHLQANTQLAGVFFAQGNFAAAISCFRQALRLQPHDSSIHYNLALALQRAGKYDEAVVGYEQALRLQPTLLVAWNNMGSALRRLGKLDDAVACYRRVLQMRPDYAEAQANLANVLAEQGKIDEAMGHYRRALSLRPEDPETNCNLGIALDKCDRFEEAAAAFRQALRFDPNHVEAQYRLGIVLQDLGKLDEALACYDQVVRIEPGHAATRQNRAMIWLLRGEWLRGWPEFEWRWQTKDFPRYEFLQPRWDGSPLEGRTLLLVAEQGLGDTLQFVRFLPVLQKQGGKVVILCQPPLRRILVDAVGQESVAVQGESPPPFDLHIPLLSVPGTLGTTQANLPAEVPYLKADAQLVEKWRQELKPLAGFKIGIAWQGNPIIGDRHRSVPLVHFRRLSQLPGVHLISLQKGLGTEQVQPGQFPLVDLGPGLDTASGPFRDTAAIMMNLDLVISSDTAVPHLAGALGVPVWLALRSGPDWRWLLERGDSPWYPTMRIFRQERLGEWNDVFERMTADVRAAISRGGGWATANSGPSMPALP